MTLKDRLALLRGGYSKKEIEALIEAEEKAKVEEVEEVKTEEVKTEETKNNTFEDVMKSLIDEVTDLKNTIYENNLKNVEIQNQVNLEDEAEKVLASLINPFKK